MRCHDGGRSPALKPWPRLEPVRKATAKHLICVWLGGGPPHTDMFDMKPAAAAEYRGEFKPIKTNVPGIEICELMPGPLRMADKYTIIRSVTTENKPGDHARPVLLAHGQSASECLPSGTEEYPMYGSAVSKFRPGPEDLPTFATLGIIDVHTINAIAELSWTGPQSTHFRPARIQGRREQDADAANRAAVAGPQRRPAQALDTGLRHAEKLDPLVEGLDQYQKTAFNTPRSPKLRTAMDLSKEDVRNVERYIAQRAGQGRATRPAM